MVLGYTSNEEVDSMWEIDIPPHSRPYKEAGEASVASFIITESLKPYGMYFERPYKKE